MMSRHKRNHINGSKQHHHSPTRHDMLSFRNNDMFEHSLHPHERLNSQRHRRDLSKCLGTHKQRRRLSIGCSRDDIVEVHPQCSEAGDEGTEICFLSAARRSVRRGNFEGSLGADTGRRCKVFESHFCVFRNFARISRLAPLWHQLFLPTRSGFAKVFLSPASSVSSFSLRSFRPARMTFAIRFGSLFLLIVLAYFTRIRLSRFVDRERHDIHHRPSRWNQAWRLH
jgi:hypothetical protein